MKILVFTDIHGDGSFLEDLRKKSEHSDLLLCAGDITIFGHEQKKILEMLDTFRKPIIMLYGNHEDPSSLKKMCSSTKNIRFSHNEAIEIKNLAIITHGGGGFSIRNKDFEENCPRFEKFIKSKEKSIAVFHAPPADTKLDDIGRNQHVGNISYRKFIEKAQPTIAICGHIHETFGKQDKIGKTLIINPGPKGAIIHI